MKSLRPHQKVVKTKCGQWSPRAQKQHIRLSDISIYTYTLWERNQENKFNFIGKQSTKSYKILKKELNAAEGYNSVVENMFSIPHSIQKTKIIFEQNN